jgi:hypothetical protein
MKSVLYLSIIIAILVILSHYFTPSLERFVNTDTGIGIGPWWAEGPGLSRGFQRCNCDSYRNCSCLDGSSFSKNIMFPQYYFNYL